MRNFEALASMDIAEDLSMGSIIFQELTMNEQEIESQLTGRFSMC